VVDAVARALPPRQILLSEPRYSCALAPLVDAYCVNPERIYGHYFLAAAGYVDSLVRANPSGDVVHPIFNRDEGLAPTERRFLDGYDTVYVLAGPPYRDTIAWKLQSLGRPSEQIFEEQGYRLYVVGR
jgi:hypothetical protein